jgi:hypothetical protein
MCSNWIVNGEYCENGADLVRVLGLDAARRVNENYAYVGGNGWWRIDKDGSRIDVEVTDALIDTMCLCSVSHDAIAAETGVQYEYDAEQDAFRPFTEPSL